MSVDRAARVADQIRQALSEAVRRDVRDPRVGFVTFTSVKLSPDLRHARVFVSTPGGPEALADALAALDHARAFLKRVVATRAKLRFTPELRFLEDVSIARGARVESLLEDIRRERGDGDDGDNEDERSS